MQIRRIGYGVKGFVRLHRYALRWAYMITDKAKHKAQVLTFWTKHGLQAAEEAFKVKKRTLYLWKAQLKWSDGNIESLNEGSRRPFQMRQRIWPRAITQEIRRLRTQHPNLGKEKLFVFLKGTSKN